MKHIVLLCDGMADLPLPQLNDQTPMTVAHKPMMNQLAKQAICGMVQTVADGFSPGSDVANLTVMGYDPHQYYTGRSPLEAAGMGIDLGKQDVTLRCNLVTLSDEEDFSKKTMVDYCAGDISTQEAQHLLEALKQMFDSDAFEYHSGANYRHCLVWHGGTTVLGGLTPPHDIIGQSIGNYLPMHENAKLLVEMMKQSTKLLTEHEINQKRIQQGLRPANGIWLWGEGKVASLPYFETYQGVKGAVVTAVDLLKGIGSLAGMKTPQVIGATGYIDTNFSGKVQACIQEIEDGCDYVYLHIEAPDECGHRGEVENKVRSLELIDTQVLTPLVHYLNETQPDYKILILPDHATPLALKTHTSDPVPFLIYHHAQRHQRIGVSVFDEQHCQQTQNQVHVGHLLIKQLLGDKENNC